MVMSTDIVDKRLGQGIGSESVGWVYNGMANRILLDLGLNLDSRSVTGMAPLTSDELRLRRQVYWALYCNDKLGASYTGRVCTMLVCHRTLEPGK